MKLRESKPIIVMFQGSSRASNSENQHLSPFRLSEPHTVEERLQSCRSDRGHEGLQAPSNGLTLLSGLPFDI